jgi:hypothetical protein
MQAFGMKTTERPAGRGLPAQVESENSRQQFNSLAQSGEKTEHDAGPTRCHLVRVLSYG